MTSYCLSSALRSSLDSSFSLSCSPSGSPSPEVCRDTTTHRPVLSGEGQKTEDCPCPYHAIGAARSLRRILGGLTSRNPSLTLTCTRSTRPWSLVSCSRLQCHHRRRVSLASGPRPASSPACCTGRPPSSSLQAAGEATARVPSFPPRCVGTSVCRRNESSVI